jgi:hypothetical protein
MQKELTANRIGGRAIGAMFFTGFGSGWLFLSLVAMQKLAAGTATGVGLSTLALLAACGYVALQAKRWPRVPDDPAMGRAFVWINVIQWTAVAAVAFGFARLHIDAYVISAITAIVGLHMFPLARLFRYAWHYVTGAALVGWAAATVLLFSKDEMQGATALGTGAILWLSALLTLALAMRAMRAQPNASQQRAAAEF